MREEIINVLIVGAVPTGLALAWELSRRGIRPMLLDRLGAGQNTSRAAVVHARTLEVLGRHSKTYTIGSHRSDVPNTRTESRVSHDQLQRSGDRVSLRSYVPAEPNESILLNRLQALAELWSALAKCSLRERCRPSSRSLIYTLEWNTLRGQNESLAAMAARRPSFVVY